VFKLLLTLTKSAVETVNENDKKEVEAITDETQRMFGRLGLILAQELVARRNGHTTVDDETLLLACLEWIESKSLEEYHQLHDAIGKLPDRQFVFVSFGWIAAQWWAQTQQSVSEIQRVLGIVPC